MPGNDDILSLMMSMFGLNDNKKPEPETETKKPKKKAKQEQPSLPDFITSILTDSVKNTGGKGMDDDVSAQIEGQQPAALSEGEYIIPADIVSLLGDGNSEAGSKILDNFLEQLRVSKTGSTKQPPKTEDVLTKG